jgi:2'-5' RNA ligase
VTGRRLFFALWPDPALQADIAATAERIGRTRAIGGRVIPAERLHLTLLFLGEVAPDAEKRLLAAADRVEFRPFDLTLDQAGCFFRSKVFWVGPSAVPGKLAELGQALHGAMAGVGLAPDRKELVPHVTCWRDIRHVIRPVPVDPMIWPVRRFALVHSVLGKKGTRPFSGGKGPGKGTRPLFPQYHVVSQWPLHTPSATNVKTVQAPRGTE